MCRLCPLGTFHSLPSSIPTPEDSTPTSSISSVAWAALQRPVRRGRVWYGTCGPDPRGVRQRLGDGSSSLARCDTVERGLGLVRIGGCMHASFHGARAMASQSAVPITTIRLCSRLAPSLVGGNGSVLRTSALGLLSDAPQAAWPGRAAGRWRRSPVWAWLHAVRRGL